MTLKKTFLFLVAAVMSIAAAGCGKKDANNGAAGFRRDALVTYEFCGSARSAAMNGTNVGYRVALKSDNTFVLYFGMYSGYAFTSDSYGGTYAVTEGENGEDNITFDYTALFIGGEKSFTKAGKIRYKTVNGAKVYTSVYTERGFHMKPVDLEISVPFNYVATYISGGAGRYLSSPDAYYGKEFYGAYQGYSKFFEGETAFTYGFNLMLFTDGGFYLEYGDGDYAGGYGGSYRIAPSEGVGDDSLTLKSDELGAEGVTGTITGNTVKIPLAVGGAVPGGQGFRNIYPSGFVMYKTLPAQPAEN
ncbi:MAG: hypothetical protein LBP26_06565 [Clostridiales bacterium]|jgi:hypothetical protein|nr:hypothetical protein [Clostridiales bacterium]